LPSFSTSCFNITFMSSPMIASIRDERQDSHVSGSFDGFR
jgi:hypothetical protein